MFVLSDSCGTRILSPLQPMRYSSSPVSSSGTWMHRMSHFVCLNRSSRTLHHCCSADLQRCAESRHSRIHMNIEFSNCPVHLLRKWAKWETGHAVCIYTLHFFEERDNGEVHKHVSVIMGLVRFGFDQRSKISRTCFARATSLSFFSTSIAYQESVNVRLGGRLHAISVLFIT